MGDPVDEIRQTGTSVPQDAAALEPLFKACYALLLSYACKYVTRETAEDIIQDVFIQLHKKGPSLHINSSIKAYLFRSVHNGCLDHIRREAIHQRYINATIPGLSEAELDYFNPDGPRQSLLQQDNLAASVWQAIEALPPKCREVVRLRYEQGLKTGEISATMGISTRTVETQLYKAIKQLRALIRKTSIFLFAIALF
ncbi:RNA polymerase sigma-70 factor [Chitinophaga varians]|uniref:RNA polymerase sigma-70 factor n=1 Tax=Chitinophaga varians TaxID=2202339 RepID=A0A847RWH7_9BACT|nr:RNA polymerase sigma-70 factor [Chitinophaga varians]NLR67372.1 RNA polymerase sigma-70 factor [Chitinophaga varians]